MYRNCTKNTDAECNLSGVYSPRKYKKTLDEAKQFCEENTDCRGITRDDNGFEPRRGLDVNNYEVAHELWLCKGIFYRLTIIAFLIAFTVLFILHHYKKSYILYRKEQHHYSRY